MTYTSRIQVLRFISAGLFLGFLGCYLEWGLHNSGFIFLMEYELFTKSKDLKDALSHPLVIIPFLGQLLLLYNTLSPRPRRRLTLYSMLLLSVLVLMILLAGLLSLKLKIILSTLPFFGFAIYFLVKRKQL